MKNKIKLIIPVINAALIFLSCAALFKTFVAWVDQGKFLLSLVFVTAVCAFAGFFLSYTGKNASKKRNILYAVGGAAAAEIVFWSFSIVINTIIGKGGLNKLACNIAVAVIIVLYGVVSVLMYKNLNTENKKSVKVLSGALAVVLAGMFVLQSGNMSVAVRRATEKNYYDANECYRYDLDFYEKLKNKEDVNVLIIGDSIGEGSGGEYGQLWFQLLENAVEKEYGVKYRTRNVSFGGNVAYCGYVSSKIFADGTDYDLAVLCYSQNDGSLAEHGQPENDRKWRHYRRPLHYGPCGYGRRKKAIRRHRHTRELQQDVEPQHKLPPLPDAPLQPGILQGSGNHHR